MSNWPWLNIITFPVIALNGAGLSTRVRQIFPVNSNGAARKLLPRGLRQFWTVLR